MGAVRTCLSEIRVPPHVTKSRPDTFLTSTRATQGNSLGRASSPPYTRTLRLLVSFFTPHWQSRAARGQTREKRSNKDVILHLAELNKSCPNNMLTIPNLPM